jgi:hypothetical protein
MPAETLGPPGNELQSARRQDLVDRTRPAAELQIKSEGRAAPNGFYALPDDGRLAVHQQGTQRQQRGEHALTQPGPQPQ